jgi:hypothetical protein
VGAAMVVPPRVLICGSMGQWGCMGWWCAETIERANVTEAR